MKTIVCQSADNSRLEEKLVANAQQLLKLKDIAIRIQDVYVFSDLSGQDLEKVENTVFQGQTIAHELTAKPYQFRYQAVPGQHNEQAYMVEKMLQDFLQLNTHVHHSTLVEVTGVNDQEFKAYKEYLLNPIEYVEIPLDYQPRGPKLSSLADLDPIDGFTAWTAQELETNLQGKFSLDLDDLLFIQEYFQSIGRNPNTTELKSLDTYWSDHCRHTTFETFLTEVNFENGFFVGLFEKAFQTYQDQRQETNRSDRPMTLMDLGTIQGRLLKQRGLAKDVVVSEEVNACAVEMEVQTASGPEDWVLYFKNETHNHPTEIEPFGGAATCLGGAIRDTLSGRSYTYQAMRISGSKDAAQAVEETLDNKLPQSTISQRSAEGYSDYGNQMGVAQAYAKEYYHDGFVAKRMEAGAVVAAAPADYIVRETPQAGDAIIVLGGKTGKDGLGAAVGSSMVQDEDSLEDQGGEVQKGNPSVEHQIARLFQKPAVTRLIKKSNDFGAGGLSVAVGELADGIHIDLDAVQLKYPEMHGGEIALSESQERMAVVVDPQNVDAFLELCAQDDVDAALVAKVTDENRLLMTWQGRTIFDIDRPFLDSNGASKEATVQALQPTGDLPEETFTDVKEYVQRLNHRNQRALVDYFDATVNSQTVLSPYGGKYQLTPELGMVSLVPHRDTTTVSAMTAGYDPDLMEYSPFHGAYFAVVDSVARLAALGLDPSKARLSLQEYFERLGQDPSRWGKPFLALLGANQAMTDIELPAIGGKDSMSGSYEDIDVPPTVISFAVTYGEVDQVLSRAFKETGSQIVLVETPLQEDLTLDLKKFQKHLQAFLTHNSQILAASTVGREGILKELLEMTYGNGIGFTLEDETFLTRPLMGSFLLELPEDFDLAQWPGATRLGSTQATTIRLNQEDYSVTQVAQWTQEPLADVYHRLDQATLEVPQVPEKWDAPKAKVTKALLPILPGTQSERDYQQAFHQAKVDMTAFVFQTDRMEASVQEFVTLLDSHDLLIIPHGAIYGNQPNQAAKGWELLLTHPLVKDAINKFVEDKFILGTGTGLDALLRVGLIEFGQVQEGSNFRLVKNPQDKFLSRQQTVHILQDSYMTQAIVGETLAVPVASAWLGMDLNGREEDLLATGQIVSYFQEGFVHQGVDGIQDPTGHILGFISNIERVADHTLINTRLTTNQASLFQAFQ